MNQHVNTTWTKIYLNPSLDDDSRQEWEDENHQLYLGAVVGQAFRCISIKRISTDESRFHAWVIEQQVGESGEPERLLDSCAFRSQPGAGDPDPEDPDLDPDYLVFRRGLAKVAEDLGLDIDRFSMIASDPADAVDPGEDYECHDDCLIDYSHDDDEAERFISAVADGRTWIVYESSHEGSVPNGDLLGDVDECAALFNQIHPDDFSESNSRTLYVFIFD